MMVKVKRNFYGWYSNTNHTTQVFFVVDGPRQVKDIDRHGVLQKSTNTVDMES